MCVNPQAGDGQSANPQRGDNLWDTPKNTRNDCATLDRSLRCACSQRAATRNRSQRSGHRLGRRFAVVAALAVGILTSNTSQATAQVHWKNHSMNLKLYALNQIKDWDQFDCFNTLIHKESSWRYWVRNGSHYGLGQMRSEWYGLQTPRKQIRLTISYIDERYGSVCEALAFHLRNGWY